MIVLYAHMPYAFRKNLGEFLLKKHCLVLENDSMVLLAFDTLKNIDFH